MRLPWTCVIMLVACGVTTLDASLALMLAAPGGVVLAVDSAADISLRDRSGESSPGRQITACRLRVGGTAVQRRRVAYAVTGLVDVDEQGTPSVDVFSIVGHAASTAQTPETAATAYERLLRPVVESLADDLYIRNRAQAEALANQTFGVIFAGYDAKGVPTALQATYGVYPGSSSQMIRLRRERVQDGEQMKVQSVGETSASQSPPIAAPGGGVNLVEWLNALIVHQHKLTPVVAPPTDVLMVGRSEMRFLRLRTKCDPGGLPVNEWS